MRLWARGDLRIPSDDDPAPQQELNDAAAAFGLAFEQDPELEEECFLWPENVRAFNLWLSVQTQWHTASDFRIGTFRTGLNYAGVETCIRNTAIRKKERPWYFATLQSMERTALEEWNKDR